MKRLKGANFLVIVIVCTLGFVIGTLTYTNNLKLNQEIKNVIETNDESEKEFEIWTIEGKIEDVLNEEIKSFQKKYPDIKFKIKAFKSEIYKQNLLNAARTNSMPDMFYTWGDEGLKELVELNAVKDITMPVDNVVKESIRSRVLESYTINERVYGLPIFGWNTVMFCNEELFKQNDISFPSTYEELLKVVANFKGIGVTPMAIGGDDAWMGSMYYMELVLERTTPRTVRAAAENKKLLGDGHFRKAAEQFRRLIILRPWQNFYEDHSSLDAVDYFCEGKSAMMLGSSWMCQSIEPRLRGKVKVIPFPTNSHSGYFKGVAGYSDGFALNQKMKMGDIDIIALYFELVRAVSDNAVEKQGLGIPIYKDQELADKSFDMIKRCYDIFPSGSYHSAYDQLLPEDEIEVYNASIKELIRGSITDKKFIDQITE